MKFNIIRISEGGRDKTPPGGRALGPVWPSRESWFSSTWTSDWNTLLTGLLPSGIEAMKGWASGAPQAQGTLGLAHCGGRGSSSQNGGAQVSRELEGSHGVADTGRDPLLFSSPARPASASSRQGPGKALDCMRPVLVHNPSRPRGNHGGGFWRETGSASHVSTAGGEGLALLDRVPEALN